MKNLSIISTLLGVVFVSISYAQVPPPPYDSLMTGSTHRQTFKAFVSSDNISNTGYIGKLNLIAQTGVSCTNVFSGNNYQVPCKVKSYKLVVVSKKQVVFFVERQTNTFDDELRKQFYNLNVGDLVVIYDIKISYYLGTENVPSIVYEIR
jgi:hypothetical protein